MDETRLKYQRDFITKKLQTCRQFNKYGLTLIDSNDVIIKSLMGELRNIIQSFFKGGVYSTKKCEHCGTTTSKQFERAHNKGCSRYNVALSTLKRIRPDETQQIKQSDFIREFIEEHKNIPLWLLCKECHKSYDKC